jgi:hypothetical protein
VSKRDEVVRNPYRPPTKADPHAWVAWDEGYDAGLAAARQPDPEVVQALAFARCALSGESFAVLVNGEVGECGFVNHHEAIRRIDATLANLKGGEG